MDAALPQEAGTAKSQHLGQVPWCRSPGERRGDLLVMLGEREPPSKTGNQSNPRGIRYFKWGAGYILRDRSREGS